jgi:diguanylate cyclase
MNITLIYLILHRRITILLKDLFVNMTILISFISLGSQLIKNYNFDENLSIFSKIVLGIMTGFLGSLLLMFSIKVSDNTLIDFRNIAIILPAILGGAISVFISGFLIAVFRIAYFGVNLSSLLGVSAIMINSIGCLYIANRKIKFGLKWLYQTIFSIFITSIVFTIRLSSRSDFFLIIFIYWVSHFIVSIVSYFYINYCITTNKLYRKLKVDSSKDYLTGLNNVRQFNYLLHRAMKIAQKKEESISLLMIDIDFFKHVNDTYGHMEGDVVLKELSKILSYICSSSGEVSRNGGEEFSVLINNCTLSQAIDIAERIRVNVQNYTIVLSTGKQISITVSIGVTTYPETTKDIRKLVVNADKALYDAKQSGRNKVCSR